MQDNTEHDYGETDHQHTQPAGEQSPPSERDRLRNIVERIQVGDTEEGVEAAQELISLAREATGRAVQDVASQAQNDAAVAAFAKSFPVLGSDEALAKTTIDVTGDELRRDLRSVGLPDENLKAMGIDQLGAVHGRARAAGLKVRDPAKLLDDVGGRLARDFNIHPGVEGARRAATARYINTQRVQRGFAPVEGIGPQTTPRPDPTRDDKERTRKYIAAARKARGFAALD